MLHDSKYFLWASIAVVVIVVGFRYQQYFVARNFQVHANVSCDPEQEACFRSTCDADTDPDCDTTPYKKVDILSKDAPACLEEHSCEAFSCEGRPSCAVNACSSDALEEGEKCLSSLLTSQ